MSNEKPTIKEYENLVQDALIEDGDYTGISSVIEDKSSLEDKTLLFIKNILSEKYDDNVVDSLLNDVEHLIPYLLNEIELTENVTEVFSPIDNFLKPLYKKGDNFVVLRDIEYINELKETLRKLSDNDRINLLNKLIRVNDDRISRDNHLYGNHSKSAGFIKKQLDLLLKEYNSAEHVLGTKNEHSDNDLSAFEIALRHWYLMKSGIEQDITSVDVSKKYKHLKSPKNIEKSYNNIFLKRKKANKKQLITVLNSLKEYPNVQKAIENDLDKI